jgi:hypothetical protein
LELFYGRSAINYKEMLVKVVVISFLILSLIVGGAFCIAGWQGFYRFIGIELIALAISAIAGIVIAWDSFGS